MALLAVVGLALFVIVVAAANSSSGPRYSQSEQEFLTAIKQKGPGAAEANTWTDWPNDSELVSEAHQVCDALAANGGDRERVTETSPLVGRPEAPEFMSRYPDPLSMQCAGRPVGELVFPGRTGGYLPRPKSDGGWFAGAVKRAAVQPITPHDLRHTCASLAVSAGVNVLALQRMSGHTSAKVTLDTYADLFDDDLDAVAESLHSRYSRTADHQSVLKMCSPRRP
jgi:hypothetical protein